jgi:hypothetical protein
MRSMGTSGTSKAVGRTSVEPTKKEMMPEREAEETAMPVMPPS